MQKGKEKAKPHFLVETHRRPPSKLPTGQERQQKFRGSALHVWSIEILKSFFSNEYGSLGTLVHHYKNCCKRLKSATTAQAMRVHYVPSAPLVSLWSVGRVPRRIRCTRRVRTYPWRPSCRSARISCLTVLKILALPPQC